MKIFFIIPSMAGGGAERVISLLSNEMVRNGHDVSILMLAGTDQVYNLDKRINVISVSEVSRGNMKLLFNRIINLRKQFRENPDAVLLSFEPDASFFSSIAKIGLKNRLISSERNDPSSFKHKKTRLYAYHQSNRVVFQTKNAMEYFPTDIQKKGVIIENPITGDLPERFDGARRKTVVTVGRLQSQKNHKLLLRAFKLFHEDYPEYELQIFGKGNMFDELSQYKKDQNMEQCVSFKGYCHDTYKQIRDAGMFVLSSDFEGMPNALMEAMGIGLPCISTDCPCGGPHMMIESGVNGILVPIRDEKKMAEAMGEIACNSELSEKMGIEASKIRNKFSIENIYKKWMEVIYEVSSRE